MNNLSIILLFLTTLTLHAMQPINEGEPIQFNDFANNNKILHMNNYDGYIVLWTALQSSPIVLRKDKRFADNNIVYLINEKIAQENAAIISVTSSPLYKFLAVTYDDNSFIVFNAQYSPLYKAEEDNEIINISFSNDSSKLFIRTHYKDSIYSLLHFGTKQPDYYLRDINTVTPSPKLNWWYRKILLQVVEEFDGIAKLNSHESQQLNAIFNSESFYTTGLHPNLELHNIDAPFGNAIFATKNLDSGSILGIYSGTPIFKVVYDTDDDENDTYFHKKGEVIHHDFFNTTYLFTLDDDLELSRHEHFKIFPNLPYAPKNSSVYFGFDASSDSNYTKFFNSTESKYTNCIFEPRYYTNLFGQLTIAILIIATKPIKKGHQVLVDYGDDYFINMDFDKVIIQPSTYTIHKDGNVYCNERI